MVFHSRQEQRLWLLAALFTLLIYTVLPVAQELTAPVRQRGWLRTSVSVCLVLGVAAFLGWLARQRPPWHRLLLLIPVIAVYAFVLSKSYAPEEELHLVEYGLLGLSVYAATRERRRSRPETVHTRDPLARWPARCALLLTSIAGWIDEAIQHLLPNRTYDLRDVGFNTVAAALAITSAAVFARRTSAEERD